MAEVQQPPVTQKIFQRRLKAFTPEQVEFLLSRKNIKFGTPQAAQYLAEQEKKVNIALNKNMQSDILNAAEGTLVKIPGNKHWQIQQPDGSLIDTGRRGQGDAAKALSAYDNITSNTDVAATNELKRENGQWSVIMEDGSTVPTGKTNKNLAAGLVSQFEQDDTPDDGGEDEDVVETQSDVQQNIIDDPSSMVSDDAKLTPQLVTEQQVQDAYIPQDTGQLANVAPAPITTSTADTALAAAPSDIPVDTYDAKTTQDEIDEATKVTRPLGELDERSLAEAQTQDPLTIAQRELEAAQDTTPTTVVDAPTRTVQEGELDLDPTFKAQEAADFAEQVQAAQGEVSELSTVKGQLAQLQKEFDNNNIPMWAAGAYRQASQAMASRGLSSSSIAGQAIVHALMEASLPIATQDAQTYAQMDMANLSNKQARVMLAAQQRATFIGQEFDQAFQARVLKATKISDIANMNFSAEQQIALENANIAATIDLANLNNKQAKIMADAAAMSQIEQINLTNSQQAAIQQAQAFLGVDMSELTFNQQASIFEAQSRVQSLFTDQAAINTARQINSQNENETNRLIAQLETQVELQNASAKNGHAQFNAGEINAISTHLSNLLNQREQFNLNNSMAVQESNINWRRGITTQNNATTNAALQLNAQNMFGMTTQGYANLWQEHRDQIDYAFRSDEAQKDRDMKLLIESMSKQGALAGAAGGVLGQIFNGLLIGGEKGFFDWLIT